MDVGEPAGEVDVGVVDHQPGVGQAVQELGRKGGRDPVAVAGHEGDAVVRDPACLEVEGVDMAADPEARHEVRHPQRAGAVAGARLQL